ncbi:hypothetical protein [Enterobacter hormaechei]|uniref:hypothetical protein n=1 Tax=Enterobacter hormaechei TaxID=158836 RepID=UPI0039C65DFB
MDKIIISIKPMYIEKILNGSKIIELRRRVGKFFIPNNEIYLYSTSPVKALVGKAIIEKVVKEELTLSKKRKNKILKSACIDECSFDKYFLGSKCCFLIHLSGIIEFQKHLPISSLKNIGITPPQSFGYIKNDIINIFEEMNK